MPEAAVRTTWATHESGAIASMRQQRVRSAAESFDVSTSAMWWRLYSFSLVPSKPDSEEVV